MSEYEVEPLTDAEKKLLEEKVHVGVPPDLKTKIPDAPDISPAPKKKGIPGTFKNRIEGLRELKPGELPVPGEHFVVWGSAHLDDIKARPVVKGYGSSEQAHVDAEVEHTKLLLSFGLKNPRSLTDPKTGAPGLPAGTPGTETWDRVRRTAKYARWRYRGFVCGEVVSL